ncbi:MAG: hypothetical protein QOF15_1411 [Mycobacterium sp.]|nr:hypothetical protein [Mycobacterium sp.]
MTASATDAPHSEFDCSRRSQREGVAKVLA